MLKLLVILALATSIDYKDTANKFTDSLTGVWAHKSTPWVIIQEGNRAAFVVSESGDFDKNPYKFIGRIYSTDKYNQFEFFGETEERQFLVEESVCAVRLELYVKGVTGVENNGRIIFMSTCMVLLHTACNTGGTNNEVIDCSGYWRSI